MSGSGDRGAGFLWRIYFRDVPRADADLIEAVLEPIADAVIQHGEEDEPHVALEALAEDEPDRERLAAALATVLSGHGQPPPAPKIDLVPPKNWVAENLLSFPPIRVGRFFIHGSHHPPPYPVGSLPLKIDAGAAFGSGSHPTTATCLHVLQEVKKAQRIKRPLDVGCGSGILAMAMAKLWRVAVTTSDIDPESVRVTESNAARNGVGHLIRAQPGAGYTAPLVRRHAPYDLITANILARPLRKLAPALARHLAPGGHTVLSGILARDAASVVSAHARVGVTLARHWDDKGWRTLLLQKMR